MRSLEWSFLQARTHTRPSSDEKKTIELKIKISKDPFLYQKVIYEFERSVFQSKNCQINGDMKEIVDSWD